MSEDREVLTVRILDKEYRISCRQEERESLLAAARELSERMREMRGARTLGTERMAMMTALNLIHEHEQIKSRQLGALDSAREAVRRLEAKLDAVLGRREAAGPLDS